MTTSVILGYLHNEHVSSSWHESLMALRDWDEKHERYVFGENTLGGRIRSWCSSEGLVEGRNGLVADFLDKTKGEWLLWLDTDMGFEPDTVDQLLAVADPVERPIVGALCFAQKMPWVDTMGGNKTIPIPTIYSWTKEEGFRPALDYPVNSLVRVAGTGSACILIHRGAFEKVRGVYEPQGQRWYEKLRNPHKEWAYIGEDLSFCLRANTCGIPIYVHTGIRTTHHKPVWLNQDDYWSHLVAQPATEQVAVIVPVRGRPQAAEPFMQSLRASTGLATAYAVVQREDRLSAAAWRKAGAQVLLCNKDGFAAKCNLAYRQTKERWLFFTGDDVRFLPGWLDHALGATDSGGQVIGTNDLGNPRVTRGEHAVHWLIGRSYIDKVGASWDGPGVVCHEGYHHWFIDDEIVVAAKQRGVWKMALGSMVEHLHPAWGKADSDSVYELGEKHKDADRELFDRRLAESVGEVADVSGVA